MMYEDECVHPGKEVTGLPSDEQVWLSFPLEESCQSCFMKPESLYPMFQWNSFPKLSPSAKLQFPHWFHFHIILTFQLMLLFFSSLHGYWDLYSNIKSMDILHIACTPYCSKHYRSVPHLFFTRMFWHNSDLHYIDIEIQNLVLANKMPQDQHESLVVIKDT